MAKISLREYIREIEALIDRGDTQKAIAHCKHLLRFYPKHIDTYRLFGKSLLEMQKYADASDIFQRVLSSVPDDFISQIGMSIIKEDENNLDAAIWHLERAFEIQPSNKAVQDELKRLYSSRDGVVPTKIRLTRGALVRMYARGELYAQAIAEIKAALIEDPNRVDLEVILARLYYLLGHKLEATETASKLISRLPYCYEANRILAEILPGTSREDDAQIFKKRVIDLDPYFEFVTESIPNPIDIADAKVMVEYLDWDPTMAESDEPDWAKSIGLEWETTEKIADTPLNNWLSSEMDLTKPRVETTSSKYIELEEEQELDETYDSDDQTNQVDEELTIIPENKSPKSVLLNVTEEETIPTWMKDVGWEVSEDANPEIEKGFNLEVDTPIADEEEDSTAEIEPGIIPDWVKQLAPPEELRAEGIIDEEDQLIDDKNFEKLFSSTQAGSEEEEDFFNNLSKSQDWMKEFENESDELTRREEAEGNSDLPAYSLEPSEEQNKSEIIEDQKEPLEDIHITFSEDELSEEDSETMPSAKDVFAMEVSETLPPMDEELVEKISETQPPDVDESSQPVADLESNWFKDFIPAEDQVVSAEEEDIEDKSFLSFLPDIGDEEGSELEVTRETEGDFSWLNALQSSVAEEDTVDENEDSIQEELQTESSSADEEMEFTDIFNLIDSSLKESDSDSAEVDLSSLPLEEKTPDWVESLMENIPEQQPEDAVTKKIDFPSFESESPINADSESIIEDSSSEEIESAFSWMEGLAAKHKGADEPLFSTSESKATTPPDWLKELQEEPIEEEPDPFMETGKELQPDILDDDLTPSWLKALQEESPEEDEIASEPSPKKEPSPAEDVVEASELEAEVESFTALEEEAAQSEDEFVAEIEQESEEVPPGVEMEDEMLSQPDELFQADEIIPQEQAEELSEKTDLEQIAADREDIKDFEPEQVATEQEDIEEFEPDLLAAEQEGIRDFEPELIAAEEDIKDVEPDQIAAVEEEFDDFVLDQTIFETEELSKVEEPILTAQQATEAVSTPIESGNMEKFVSARQFLQKGKVEDAVSLYNELIQSQSALDEIIVELKESLDHHFPIDISLWQTLGDAYVRKNQLQNALDAYTKAEELIS